MKSGPSTHTCSVEWLNLETYMWFILCWSSTCLQVKEFDLWFFGESWKFPQQGLISHEMCAPSPMLLGWVQINENDLVSKIDYRGPYVISFKVNWFGIISERFGEILEVLISSRGYLTIRLHQACFVVLSMLLCISNLACPSLNLYLFLGRTVKYRTSSGGCGECWF